MIDRVSVMIVKERIPVGIRPWSEGDLPLLERLLGDPAMTEHLGGPESPEKIRDRHERYCRISRDPSTGLMFAIVAGPEGVGVGSVGYWEREWQGETVFETGWSVLPEFQGQGIATRATVLVAERARAEGKHRFMHAFPAVDNGPSNAICRKVGFTFQGAFDFEYPPGHPLRCNDWRLDLTAAPLE
jgi:RimJ/RimL family protein N-acetyltransferase